MQATTVSKTRRHLDAIMGAISAACGPEVLNTINAKIRELEKAYCFSDEGQEPCTEAELVGAREIMEWMDCPTDE